MLQKIQPSTPERTPAAISVAPTLPKTPTTAGATRTLAAKVFLKSIITNGHCNPEQIRQLCQSAIINATLRQKAEEDLQELQAAAAARSARQKPGKRLIQKGGVIYAYSARKAVNKHLEKEAEAIGKAAARKHIAEAQKTKKAKNKASGSQNL